MDEEAVETILAAYRYGEMTRDEARTDLILAGVHTFDVDAKLDAERE